MRQLRFSPLPCDFCGARPGALAITDARPSDFSEIGLGIREANPGDARLCDDCDTARTVRRWFAESPELAQRVYCAATAEDYLRRHGVKDWQAKR